MFEDTIGNKTKEELLRNFFILGCTGCPWQSMGVRGGRAQRGRCPRLPLSPQHKMKNESNRARFFVYRHMDINLSLFLIISFQIYIILLAEVFHHHWRKYLGPWCDMICSQIGPIVPQPPTEGLTTDTSCTSQLCLTICFHFNTRRSLRNKN